MVSPVTLCSRGMGRVRGHDWGGRCSQTQRAGSWRTQPAPCTRHQTGLSGALPSQGGRCRRFPLCGLCTRVPRAGLAPHGPPRPPCQNTAWGAPLPRDCTPTSGLFGTPPSAGGAWGSGDSGLCLLWGHRPLLLAVTSGLRARPGCRTEGLLGGALALPISPLRAVAWTTLGSGSGLRAAPPHAQLWAPGLPPEGPSLRGPHCPSGEVWGRHWAAGAVGRRFAVGVFKPE